MKSFHTPSVNRPWSWHLTFCSIPAWDQENCWRSHRQTSCEIRGLTLTKTTLKSKARNYFLSQKRQRRRDVYPSQIFCMMISRSIFQNSTALEIMTEFSIFKRQLWKKKWKESPNGPALSRSEFTISCIHTPACWLILVFRLWRLPSGLVMNQ